MALMRCPVCGEKFSDTYLDCPFCEEEETLRDGNDAHRRLGRGKRVAHGLKYHLLTPTLIALIVLMGCLLVYLLWGGQMRTPDGKVQEELPPIEELTPNPSVDDPEITEDPQQPDIQMPDDDPTGVMPEVPDVTTPEPEEPDNYQESSQNYADAAKLPNGLSLSTTDFTMNKLGDTHTIRVSGGNGSYQWFSKDDGIASVDKNGKVTAVSSGMTSVLVTDGSKKAVCIVRISASSGSSGSSDTSSQQSGSELRAGAAEVINAGNGVFVRSGPGTTYEKLATLVNGSNVKVVESAGDDWYQITFANVNGQTVTGYMKSPYLRNK